MSPLSEGFQYVFGDLFCISIGQGFLVEFRHARSGFSHLADDVSGRFDIVGRQGLPVQRIGGIDDVATVRMTDGTVFLEELLSGHSLTRVLRETSQNEETERCREKQSIYEFLHDPSPACGLAKYFPSTPVGYRFLR